MLIVFNRKYYIYYYYKHKTNTQIKLQTFQHLINTNYKLVPSTHKQNNNKPSTAFYVCINKSVCVIVVVPKLNEEQYSKSLKSCMPTSENNT